MREISNLDVIFDSQNEKYKFPFGASPCNKKVIFNIYINNEINCSNIYFVAHGEKKIEHCMEKIGEETINNKIFSIWNLKFNTFSIAKTIFYYFKIYTNDDKNFFYYGNNLLSLGGVGEIYKNNPLPFQITLYYEKYSVPSWFKNSIFYQIFPDRFYNGNKDKSINHIKNNSFIYKNWSDIPKYIKNNDGSIAEWDFFGGNLKGITEKLDYFKSLNISSIYLNPIFEATSNHRYNTGNFFNIDPILGSYEDFKTMISTFKKNNICFILDGVFNHVGKESVYFESACKSETSPFYHWFKFINYPYTYESWWGINDLPTVNELEPSFLNYIVEGTHSVISHWTCSGISGWRLDVADELPSYFIERLKYKCKQLNPESVIIGEVWEDASNKVSYGQLRTYFNGLQLDSVMNYPFRKNLIKFFNNSIDGETICKYMNSLKENYPRENYYSALNLLSSHDEKRIKTEVKDILSTYSCEKNIFETYVNKLLKSLSLIQFTFVGVPCIYYGDEAGLEGNKDPDNRRTYPWGSEDKNLVEWYKKITSLRSRSKVLKGGEILFVSPHPDIFGYIRFIPNENNFYLLLANRSLNEVTLTEKMFNKNFIKKIKELNSAFCIILTSGDEVILNTKFSATGFSVTFPPLETYLFRKE